MISIAPLSAFFACIETIGEPWDIDELVAIKLRYSFPLLAFSI